MTTIIYCIENHVNNKKYIGKTRKTLDQRWKEHLQECKRNNSRLLYKSMNKYGISNFSICELERCEDSLASARESYWIEKYHTYYLENNSCGYNMTPGGDGQPKYRVKDIIEAFENNKTIQGAARELGCDRRIVRWTLKREKGLSLSPVFHFSKDKEFEKQVIDLYINQQWSIRKIAKHYSCARRTVTKIIKNNNIPIRSPH